MGCFDAGTATTTQKIAIPDWLSKAAKSNIKRAQGIADQPFASYTDDRLAGFTPDTIAAFDAIRGIAPDFMAPSGYGDLISGAAGSPIMQTSTPSLLSGDISEYMNPYMSTVMADTMREFNEQMGKDMLNIGSTATMSGAFGDARHGVLEADYLNKGLESRGELANKMMADAFSSGVGLKQQDISNALNTFGANVGSYENALSRMISGYGAAPGATSGELANILGMTGALSGVGAQQQGLQQAGLDVDWAEFLREQAYPTEMMNLLNATTSMQPYTKTQTTESPTASPLASVLGPAATIFSMI